MENITTYSAGVSSWRYGAKNSASENFLAPRAAFAAPDNAAAGNYELSDSLEGHAANARCSTVAPQRRLMHHGHTYQQPNKRACAYGRRFLCMRSARNCFGAAFSAPVKINFDTPAVYAW